MSSHQPSNVIKFIVFLCTSNIHDVQFTVIVLFFGKVVEYHSHAAVSWCLSVKQMPPSKRKKVIFDVVCCRRFVTQRSTVIRCCCVCMKRKYVKHRLPLADWKPALYCTGLPRGLKCNFMVESMHLRLDESKYDVLSFPLTLHAETHKYSHK